MIASERWERRAAALGAFWQTDPEAVGRAKTPPWPIGSVADLDRVPLAVKDVLDVAGMATSGGIRGEAERAEADSEAVARLRRAGAVPVGKTAMDPLGWSTSGQAAGHPPCLNPVDPSFSPGGSSSGSAVAVAAGLVPLALGTDLSGSVRIPAAYCGVVGFRPRVGAIPAGGSLAIAPRFDSVGLIAGSVEACLSAYRVLAEDVPPAAPGVVRVRVLDDLLGRSSDAVARCVSQALGKAASPRLVFSPGRVEHMPRGYGRLLAGELERSWGEEVRRRPADFSAAIRADLARLGEPEADREELDLEDLHSARRRAEAALGEAEVVACPTVPIPAPDRGDERTATSVRFTRIFNALDWPAFSLPCGSDGEGRPIGLQLASPPDRLDRLFAAAAAVETSLRAAAPGSARGGAEAAG